MLVSLMASAARSLFTHSSSSSMLRTFATSSTLDVKKRDFYVPQVKRRFYVPEACSSDHLIVNTHRECVDQLQLDVMNFQGKYQDRRPKRFKNPLGLGCGRAKGVVVRNVVKNPKKPNSGNRKCVIVRLSSKQGHRKMTAYVPGEGHNLQEHNNVMVHIRRLRDCVGVKLYCDRGALDLPHVKKK